jgi:predicted RNase H-like HicB family nuclease
MMRYIIIIEKAENNYSAYCPDLPGCVAIGDTIEETKRNMREAVAFHIRGIIEDGDPIPTPSEAEWIEIPIAS